jgi:hypothetical protein
VPPLYRQPPVAMLNTKPKHTLLASHLRLQDAAASVLESHMAAAPAEKVRASGVRSEPTDSQAAAAACGTVQIA